MAYNFARGSKILKGSSSRGVAVSVLEMKGDTEMKDGYKKGFADQTKEIAVPSLEIEGVIPGWLSGTLIRNGPARFHLEDKTLNHWFDGLAMLHKFDIANGQISYANKFLDTPALRAAKDGTMKYGEFATDPCHTLFKRITQVFTGSTSGANANVSVGKIAGEFVAQTELLYLLLSTQGL